MIRNETVISNGQKITKERLKAVNDLREKMVIGDYLQIASMLGIKGDTARKRFRRGKGDALKAMQTIIKNREQLIKDFQNKKLAV